jgi:threonyl-tRNA synthetase
MSVKEFRFRRNSMDVAKSISEGFCQKCNFGFFNGTTWKHQRLTTDGSLILYTWNDESGKKAFGI